MNRLSRFLSAIGFLALSCLCGVGVSWILVAILWVRNDDARLTRVMPALVIGGIIGLIAGAIAIRQVARKGLKTRAAIDDRYVGARGRGRIYSGIPVLFVIVFGVFFFEPLLGKLGTTTGTWTAFGIFLGIVTICLVVEEHIPKRWLLPLGVIGWLLTLLILGIAGLHTLWH